MPRAKRVSANIDALVKSLSKDNTMEITDKNPGPLLAVSGSYWQACALHAGVVTDIFTAMADKPATGSEIAQRINADARATEMLLNTLSTARARKTV